MSALAHYLETDGLATTLISLIRENSDKIRPPRALWVPFELGRPLGVPNDPAFQKRVLTAALDLLSAKAGPITVDFPEEATDRHGDPTWSPPAVAEAGTDAAALKAEVAAVAALHPNAVKARDRTVFGLTEVGLTDIGDFFAAFLNGEQPASPRSDMRLSDFVKAAMEDLKSAYGEIASIGSGRPSSMQIADWFWGGTAAGRTLLELHVRWADGDDKRLKIIAQNFMIPRTQRHRLE